MQVYSPSNGLRTLDIPPGKIGVSLKDWYKRPKESLNLPNDPRWEKETAVIEKLHLLRNDIAETAIFRAVKSGCPLSNEVQLFLAQLALDDLRYADAMNFSWFLIDAPQPNLTAARIFLNAAIASYKLEAAADVLERCPEAAQGERLQELKRLIAAQKALPQAARVPPLAAADKLCWDPLIPQGVPVPKARATTEEYLGYLNKFGRFGFNAINNEVQCCIFTPEVKNICIQANFILRETNPIPGGYFGKDFSIGVIEMNQDRAHADEEVVDADGRKWKAGEVASVTGYIAHMLVARFSPENVRVSSWSQALSVTAGNGFIAEPDKLHKLKMAIVDGDAEITVDGKRLFYGPADLDNRSLGVVLVSNGMTCSLRFMQAYELSDEAAYKAKVGPVVNKAMRLKTTRLHHAAAHFEPASVKLLLDLNADPNLKDANDETPLQQAMGRDNLREIAAVFAAHGVKLDLPTAAALGDIAKVLELLNTDPQTARNSKPWSALHGAACVGDVEIGKLLIERGADINSKAPGWYDNTPLHVAAEHKQKAFVDLLLSKGAEVNRGDREKRTPLVYAQFAGATDIEKALKEHNAVLREPEPSAKPVKPPPPPKQDF